MGKININDEILIENLSEGGNVIHIQCI